MNPSIRYGLILGVIALFLIVPVSAFLGVCGPAVALLAGTIAGYLTASRGNITDKPEGTKRGAIAGAITGGLALLGQVIGAILALVLLQRTGGHPLFGEIPSVSATAQEQLVYYASGAGTGVCLGSFGILLGAAAGAIGGRFGVRPEDSRIIPQ